MRRGHPGIGNWRGENPRHFRPRGGGTPHLRPLMSFGPLDSPRFPPPIQRYRGPRPYNSHPNHTEGLGPSDHETQYRGQGHPNSQMRSQERLHDNHTIIHMRKNNRGGHFNQPGFFDGNNYSQNNMGDIDHRVCDVDQRPQIYSQLHMSPWNHPPFERRNYNNDKNPKHYNMGDSLLPQPDYTGHRPPSSDHYSGDTGPNNNNNPYSHSVDDTVNIVRKRLMNRDSQDPSGSMEHMEMDIDMRKSSEKVYHDTPQEQPVKKRVQRQIKSNCDKMKNKIVHQLFKMDKGKIHKLMDNPNSSSKFEYAISSLITESQNSFNRHMRSVAEKSLSTTNSSSDFIHDDSNTIYEDTFMRQMQGILDPQDTVLLEDIKPLVLAELSKVLCLDDFDRCEEIDDHSRHPREEYYNEHGSDYSHNAFYECYPEPNQGTETITGDLYDDRKYDFTQEPTFDEPTPLFERRQPKRDMHDERSRSRSTESWQNRRSVENNSVHNRSNEEKPLENPEPRPLFDGNCDQLSGEDDPFADLDNQYHVAVDHNFIEQEDGEIVSPIPDHVDHKASEPPPIKNEINDTKISLTKPETPANDIIKKIDTQLHSIASSQIKLFTTLTKERENFKALKVKQEIAENVAAIKDNLEQKVVSENVKVKKEHQAKEDSELVKHANDSGKHNSRKRSVDSKPSHRKEKRKKSSHSECHEAATSIFNMFYDKPEKDSSPVDKKGYSDKYVKRKEPPKKSNKTPDTPKPGTQKKHNSNHSNTSPKDISSSCAVDQTSKSDKVKLTTIDIFSEGAIAKPKKSNVHQAHRNTSIVTPPTVPKSPDESKIKPIIPTVTSFARKLTRRHMGTQVIRKIRNKECQTLVLKKSAVGVQTDPVRFDKNQRLSEDPLERMKEIDMEIQMLLQEKFKLYNSMETRSKNNIGSGSSLGMAVLNVPIETEENEKEDNVDFIADSIAEEFTSLPIEELEQIAMETVEDKKRSSPAVGKQSRKQKIVEMSQKKSESPTLRKKKSKTPNISLLEQIISDDRPIEEIISLDDLETTPVRTKKKTTAKSSKKKPTKKRTKPLVINSNQYGIKDCSVVIERLDLKAYLKARADYLKIKISLKSLTVPELCNKTDVNAVETAASPEKISPEPQERPSPPKPTLPSIVEEPTNDIQIDMMEVCEDIVIGDEVKAVSDLEEREPVTEDIILDNSQSSVEYSAPEMTEGECKMYDYSTDDILKRDSVTVTGNADAVLAIECTNNSFIAACLDGNVYHFSTDGQLVSTLRGSNLAVTCLTIVEEKYGTTVYTGSLDSRIRYYDLDTGLEKGPECNVLSPIQTMDRAWDTVFVGTRTGFVLQFECKNNMLIPVSTVKFSEQSILALRAMKEGPRKVLLVAARSDNVTIKDAQTGLLLRTLEGPKMTVYSLLYEDGKVYCGTSSHQIHVFDYTSGSHVHAHSGGKGAVCLRATGGLVFAGCYDGCVYVYREGETRPLAQLRGPALMLLSLAIQGTKIIAGYKDRSLFIWKIPLAVLQEMIL